MNMPATLALLCTLNVVLGLEYAVPPFLAASATKGGDDNVYSEIVPDYAEGQLAEIRALKNAIRGLRKLIRSTQCHVRGIWAPLIVVLTLQIA